MKELQDMPQSANDCATLVELLRMRASQAPHQLAYTFLQDGIREAEAITYADLDRAARAVAVDLLQSSDRVKPGGCVLLVYPPGLEFLAAFFGCLYAGLIGIPAPPPDGARIKRTFPRLRTILDDSGSNLVLTTDAIYQFAHGLDQGGTIWKRSEHIDRNLADSWRPAAIGTGDLAYLQYTSGSTSSPKGVCITHASVLRNLRLFQRAWGYSEDSISVTWMPYFHDYGLVDGLLQPLYTGIPCYVLSPVTFIKRPLRWLEAIHRYRGTHTQAPNFAYEHCLKKITPQQRDALDLSSLRVASTGAEPVRESTLRRFVDYFAPSGFRPAAFCPGYGLAEATLVVATKRHDEPFNVCEVDAAALERDGRYMAARDNAIARSLVSCGPPVGDLQLQIVNPQTARRCAIHEVGEIWVSDPSVASGYWGRTEESAAVFKVRLSDAPDLGEFLRTGDLGFVREGELYMTGRLKDLIITGGVNHYPQDIEWTVQQCHAGIRTDSCAAFSVEEGGEERLVVVAELNQAPDDWQALIDAVRRAVSEEHELDLYALVALRKGAIFKTSSGKVQRHQCRLAFLEGTLGVHKLWRKSMPGAASAVLDKRIGANLIVDWLIATLASRLQLPACDIDPRASFASYGLTSRIGVELVGDLEQLLGRDNLSPTLPWLYPSIWALSNHLAHSEIGAPVAPTAEWPRSMDADVPLAIIGMACRLPGADNPDEFWQLLLDKREAIQKLPSGRWQGCGIPVVEGVGPGRITSLRGGFLDEVDRFDAGLFGIGPREAQIMDPQQRLLLELAWEVIERAGYNVDELAGSETGVFIGISTDDYTAWQFGDADNISAYTGPAKAQSIAANRISYQFDFVGPSMAIDTACSSSLVAIHQASQALRRGECSLALVGGVNLILAPHMSIALSQAGMLAPDGRCKTFDAAADGYVRGEGCCLLLLKRLDDASRDGDSVVAVIRGSAVNQDGRSNGLTAPNGLAQQRVVSKALLAAGVQAAQIGYIEAHGTGTALGDPIEVKSLQTVLTPGRGQQQRCALGAAKANIGHLEAAAGVAGVIKAALSLMHGEIPPHPHLNNLNPLIDLEGSPFFVPTQSTPWPEGRRLAGVSSFGFGGTNAHVVMEAPVSCVPPGVMHGAPSANVPDRPVCLLALCARDQGGLRALAVRWIRHLDNDATGSTLADQCFSANSGRARLPERLVLLASDGDAMKAALDNWLQGRPGDWFCGTARLQRPPRIGFLFTGQGSQYVGMGRELYESQPGFRRDMDQCDALWRANTGSGLLNFLYGAELDSQSEDRLAKTEVTQPVLFALEYSLARLWMSWGVQPIALLGHSIGEYVAACIAGVFSLSDGLRMVSVRARMMAEAPGDGAMVAVFADEVQCRSALAGIEDQVVIASYNGPRNHVLAGERSLLEKAVARLTDQGIETHPLKVSHAFHSPLMESVSQGLALVAGEVSYKPATIPVFSNLTGDANEAQMTQSAYWEAQLRSPVRFSQGVRAMYEAGVDTFIEIGPRPTLLASAQQCLEGQAADLHWLPSMRPTMSDVRLMLEGLASLHLQGAPVDWRGFEREWPRRRVPVPTYAFQGERYWLPGMPLGGVRAAAGAPFPGRRVSSPLLDQTLFENSYEVARMPLLGEHRVFGQVVVPAASHLSLVLGATASLEGESPCTLHDVIFPQALVIPESGTRRIQLAVAREISKDGRLFNMISLSDETGDAWEQHVTGRLTIGVKTDDPVETLSALRARFAVGFDQDFYKDVWQSAIVLGPRFRWVTQLCIGEKEVLARLNMPAEASPDAYRLHPGLIDSMLQVLSAAVDKQGDEALVPFSVDAFRCIAPAQGVEFWSHVRLRSDPGASDEVHSDVCLYGADGRLIAEARGFRARRLASRHLIREKAGALNNAAYGVRWEVVVPNVIPAAGAWLVVGEQAEAVEALACAMGKSVGADLKCMRSIIGPRIPNEHRCMHLPIDNGDALHLKLTSLGRIDAVVYLAAVSPAEPSLDSAISACAGVMQLIQALLALPAPTPQLVLVTQASQAVSLKRAPRPDQAAIWGLAKVVRLEHPELRCRCLDLSNGEDPGNEIDNAAAILAHTEAGQNDECDLVLRGGRYWAPRLERCTVSQPTPHLRDDRTYLISGGHGALGARLARWLVERGARHLLLLGRRGPTQAAAKNILELTRQGVNVQTREVDIADAGALAETLPPVAGIFHLAGVLEDAMVSQQSRLRLANVFSPKLGGALNLHRAFAGIELDYFVCFSSVSALTGSIGQSGYAAANAAMDALMEMRRFDGRPGISIQWGPWAETGMAADQPERERRRFSDYGIVPIEPAAGMTMLGQLLTDSAATQAVFQVQWQTFLGQLYGAKFPPMYRELSTAGAATPSLTVQGESAGGTLAERMLAATGEEGRAMLDDTLREVVTRVLGLKARQTVAPRQRLFELGLDSLGAIELRSRLAAVLGRNLRATLLFDYPTLMALGDHIEQEVLGVKAASTHEQAAPAGSEDLNNLSDVELAGLLRAELGA